MQIINVADLQTRYIYSDRYQDDNYIYRHVICPKEIVKILPHDGLMTEEEWRSLGIQQSRGWTHYAIHRPERHIILFRRPLCEITPCWR